MMPRGIGLSVLAFVCGFYLIDDSALAQENRPRAGKPQSSDLPEILDAAYQQWLQEMAVTCTFEVFRGTASTEDEALSLPVSQMKKQGSGLYTKMGMNIRTRFVPEGEVVVEKQKGSELKSNVPHDEMANGWVGVHLELPNSSSPSTYLAVREKPTEKAFALQAGRSTNDVLTPVYIAGRHFITPFAFGGHIPTASQVQITVESQDDEQVVIKSTLNDGIWNHKRLVTFAVDQNPPVITRVQNSSRKPNGYWVRQVTVGSHFVETSAGLIAKTLHYLSSQKDQDLRVMVWKSEDLGAREPDRNDFTIQVPKNCRILGLSDDFDLGSTPTVNLLDIKPEHLATKKRKRTNFNDLEAAAATRSVSRLLIVNLFIVAAAFAAFWWKRRQSLQSP